MRLKFSPRTPLELCIWILGQICSSQDKYLVFLLWWSTRSMSSISSFTGVRRAAEKWQSFVQFNASDWPDSDFWILLFPLDDFWEMAAPAGLLFAHWGFNGAQGCSQEAALPYSAPVTLIWLEQMGKALLGGEMLIKSDISYNPLPLKSTHKIPFSSVEQKMIFFSFFLLKFAFSLKFPFCFFIRVFFISSFSHSLSYSFCLYHKQATIKNKHDNKNHQQHTS